MELTVPAFQPLTASSPRLSPDFVPDLFHFSLYDDFHPRHFLVCDPVSRRYALFHPPPVDEYSGGRIFSAALLSRDADAGDGGLRFQAVCVALDVDRPRAWVATYRDGECRWRAMPRSRDVAIEFDPYWLEYLAVRAAGSLYWHICYNPCALALDTATLEFSFLHVPALMFDGASGNTHKCRIGEMPEDRQLCVGSLESRSCCCVCGGAATAATTDIDAGRTGKVFIGTLGYGIFSYQLDTGKLESLATEDGMQYGQPNLALLLCSDE
ncbi:hypothetical protein E2562_000174 [Oryza meyeriana var. granulata]|uniref:Uncharacterized protein n=1 Tax=Oryza meyeriana var. granulata TaxID=110450 RepID=A0A6G1DBR7_9ORYZ|nr:hypothetical protein E2562_000174 [Oryza meyeriana var. granulata]